MWTLSSQDIGGEGGGRFSLVSNRDAVTMPRMFVTRARFTLLCIVVFSLGTVKGAERRPPWEVGKLEPSWAKVRAKRTVRHSYDAKRGEVANGAALAKAVRKLVPGDRLEIDPGRYSISAKCVVSLRGTAEAPIWIAGSDPKRRPVITRPDGRQNVINVGERSRTEFVCFRDLEITGGSTLIRFYDCREIWLDRCELHHAGHEGITTNTRHTEAFFITNNHFHHFLSPNATGEAMYLGANHGKAVMSYSVIANNHVHECGGRQGDGIELKQGSHHNWIVGNHVHDTKYPSIIAYGTAGKGVNVIERNVCYRSGDNVMQVQGEAIVRKNLLISGAGAGFASTDHQGKTRNLTFVDNTVISARRGLNLSSWNGREKMRLERNAIYTRGGDAIRFPRGSQGVVVRGNVVVGRVSGVGEGFTRGQGLEDFRGVTWDGRQRDARPKKSSPAAKAGAFDAKGLR